ncbi:MAG: L-type lectin-domain containing protein [Candidatus Binatia bacterium]
MDLTPVIVAWDGQTSSHSEVHAWYHWAIDWRDISEQNMNQKYKDPDVLAQQETLSAEASAGDETTRKLLFGSQPLFNPFALNKLTDVMGKYGAAERTDENALQLTTLEENIAGSAFMSEKISGDFVAEFTFFMKDRNDFAAADGFTFAVVKADQSLLGHTGGLLGYGGLSGFAVAFDTFYNPEHNDPLNPARRVSLRINGEPQWKSLSSLLLPEAANSGNRFRVRVKLLQEKLHVRVYSFGADKSVTYTHTFSPESVPSEKRVGFTASTGSGAQRHLIDDVLIMPLNSN